MDRFRKADPIGHWQDLTRAREDAEPFSLPNLKELVVDLLGTTKPFQLKRFLSIFTLFEDAPLTSLVICSRSQTIPELPLASYDALVSQHTETLRRVVLVKMRVPNLALESICKRCKRLEIAGMPVPSAADLVCDLRWLTPALTCMAKSTFRPYFGRSGWGFRWLTLISNVI